MDIGICNCENSGFTGNKVSNIWTVNTKSGYKNIGGKKAHYARKFKKNDVVAIRVKVTQRKASIRYFCNNTDLGIAFDNLDIPLFPYLVFTAKAKITIMNY